MEATTYEIVGRWREKQFAIAYIEDFELREQGRISAKEIVVNPHVTLYSLDLENRLAVFVETPPTVDLYAAPFFFVAQFEQAVRVLTIPFETMIELAKSVELDDKRLVFVHSTGRAGSTLASKIFDRVEGVVSISEPDALMLMLIARFSNPGNETEHLPLLDAVIRLLCKATAEKAWIIKVRSYVIELADWLHRLYPQARNLFLYRNAEKYLLSAMRTIIRIEGKTAEEIREAEIRRRADMGIVIPLVNSYDPDKHLTSAGILALMWLSVMERVARLHEQGVEMRAIRYASWQSAPLETAVAMLEYCNCVPNDLAGVEAALAADSQAGTTYAWGTVAGRKESLEPADLAELNYHLAQHPFINSADYEAPNTLPLL